MGLNYRRGCPFFFLLLLLFLFLLLLLLFEFVIKGGSEGWKETLQESKFILDSG